MACLHSSIAQSRWSRDSWLHVYPGCAHISRVTTFFGLARTEYLLDLLSTSTPESFVVKDPALIGPSVKQQATCAIDTQPWRSVSIYSEPLSQQIFVPNLGGSGGSISSAQSVSSSDFSENTNKGQQSSGSFGHEQYEVSTTTSRLTGTLILQI